MIFVVDCADKERIEEAKKELLRFRALFRV